MTTVVLPATVPLDGDWQFYYQPDSSEPVPSLPRRDQYEGLMPVPGYWDDHLDNLRATKFWSNIRTNPKYRPLEFPMGQDPRDAELPYLWGIGWYRKVVTVEPSWLAGRVAIQLDGASMEAWIWLNGERIGHHIGNSTPCTLSATHALQPGDNELIIAVSNARSRQKSCLTSGYQGYTGGLHGSVTMRVTGNVHLADCYVHPTPAGELHWQVDVGGDAAADDLSLAWSIHDARGALVRDGHQRVSQAQVQFDTSSAGLSPWTDHSPELYQLRAELRRGDVVLDRWEHPFGMRRLARDGVGLLLNGRPVMLRGATEHAYFPLTCTPPREVSEYRNDIRKLQEIGFNWLRFHTWVPPRAYLQAADELGMMVQIEPPQELTEEQWIGIIRICRRHPSVVLYCCGNEQVLDDAKIDQLRTLAEIRRRMAPEVLFSPQEALRGVEYYFSWDGKSAAEELGADYVAQPYPHSPRRLNLLKEFSDVFEQCSWGMVTGSSVKGDWRILDARLAAYERPCLSHEICTQGGYLDLDLQHRYAGTRIGEALYASVRQNLTQAGLIDKAALYYRNSCAWMRVLRKHALETIRKCQYTAGYDFLCARDHHWHRSGYPCGILNEFYEIKPGESAADVRRYNGESVLLLDVSNYRNLRAGSELKCDVMTSLFGDRRLETGTLSWWLEDGRGLIHARGEERLTGVPVGKVKRVATLACSMPNCSRPTKVRLRVRLSGGEYELDNDWDFWVFPNASPTATFAADAAILDRYGAACPGLRPVGPDSSAERRVVKSLEVPTIQMLEDGGTVVLLGHGPFASLPTSFQIALAGRALGNQATVVADHPLFDAFPHDGFCDFQFYSMLQQGHAVLFDDMPESFDPIVEVVSSFKIIRKQAAVFEARVGRGKLLVCSLDLDPEDAGASYLLGELLRYAQSNAFRPHTALCTIRLRTLTREPARAI